MINGADYYPKSYSIMIPFRRLMKDAVAVWNIIPIDSHKEEAVI